MVIDFHTHVFPDKIAEKTINFLAEKANIPPFSNGTVNSLVEKMEEAGVDISITLPIVTKPSQFDSINNFAIGINETFKNSKRKLISFGGIHPRCEDIEGKMQFIHEKGLLGVKIHPDYQGCFINDDGYFRILEAAKKYDLIVVTHSGVDVGFPGEPVKCTPTLVRELIDSVNHKKFVLAHYGANFMFDEVYDLLCGKDVYFDTAYNLRFIEEPTFKKILDKHGEDKILFATDSPWSGIKGDLEILRSFMLPKEAEEKILYKNALSLLGNKI